jgi:hypothetical protein
MIRLRNRARRIAGVTVTAALLATATLAGILAAGAPGGHEHQRAGRYLVMGSRPRPDGLLGTLGKTVTGLVDTTVAPAAPRRNPWRIPRATADRPDRKSGPQIHAIYLVPSDRKGGALDRKGILDDSVRAISRWMRRQSGYKWRFDTFAFTPAGTDEPVAATDVTYVRAERPASELGTINAIWAELERKGLTEPEKRYLVYAVAPGAQGYCGQSFYPQTQDPSDVGPAAVVFLDSPEGCHARSFAPNRRTPSWAETIATHELFHNEGAVQRTAPNDCKALISTHVCTPILVLRVGQDPQEKDVMFTYVVAGLARLVLDLGRDDYFDHSHAYRDAIDSPYVVRAVRHQ